MKDYYQGIIQGISETEMTVYANDKAYTFTLPDPVPAIGQRVLLEYEEGAAPSILTLEPTDDMARKMYRFDRLATHRMPTADDMNDEWARIFWEQGYLVVDQLLNPAELEEAQQAVTDIIHGRIEGPRLQVMKKDEELVTPEQRELAVRKLYNFIDFAPALHRVCYHKGIWSMLERIFGEEPKFLGDQAILKPPSHEAGGEKPWHQDMAYGVFSQTKMICGVWVSLDHANIDNGCMHIIPGSHRDGAVPHYALRDWQICDASIALDKDVAVPIKPGGALFFAGLLHHGTPPNASNRRRRALQFHYGPTSSTRMTPQEFKLMFTNEMTNVTC